MAENNIKGFNVIFAAFITLVLGVAFVQQIADNEKGATELSSVTNESIAITLTSVTNESITITGASGATSNRNITHVTFFGNGTNSTGQVGIDIYTQVNFTTNGTIRIGLGTNYFSNGVYNISYRYSNAGFRTAKTDVVSISFFGNATHNSGTGYDIAQTLNFTKATGQVEVDLDNITDTDYNISYRYEGDLYISDSTSRTLISNTTLLFVVGLLLLVVAAIIIGYPEFFG